MNQLLNKNKHLLILGGSHYYKHTYARLKNRGFKITCIDNNPQTYCKGIADNFVHADYSNIDLTFRKIKLLDIDCVLPMNDVGVITSALLAEKLSFKALPVNVAKRAVSKALMKKQWLNDDLPTPQYIIAESYDKVLDAANTIGFPLILKPANSYGGGSRGVIVVDKIHDLLEATKFTKEFCDDSKIIIEEFIHYQSEHSIECLVNNGEVEVILIGDNHKMDLPFRVNQKITYPTNLSTKVQTQLIKLCHKSIHSLGIKFGAVHIEIGCNNNKLYLIELGARAGGGAIFHPITELVTGYDYAYETIKVLLNQKNEKTKKTVKKKVEYQFITNQFINTKIDRLKERLEKDPRVFDYHIEPFYNFKKKIKTGLDRQGYIISVDDV